ncbi:MAG: D-aminoacylase [Clostridia bacterium]|nr:D-aminoacylase [Clostridia bacterium]
MYDILIKNARVMDGTGAPAFTADVAVKDGKIVLPVAANARGREVVDAAGLTLCPGFIDAHSHGDRILGTEAGRLCKVSQGITTEIAGQCGNTIWPISTEADKRELMLQRQGAMPEGWENFTALERYLQWADAQTLACNYMLYVGHSALRIAAMGYDDRRPTAQELEHMKAMVREAMEHGAVGISSGLIYAPGCYADEEELVELCKVVAEYDGVYATHMRNEGDRVEESVAEAIRIAEKAGCRLCISHHKVSGKNNWGKSENTLQQVRDAIARGVSVTLDQYPYTASSTGLNSCLPKAVFSCGPEKLREKLNDPAFRASIREQVDNGRKRGCGGWSGVLVTSAANTPEAAGLTVEEYGAKIGKEPFEACCDILAAGNANAIYFTMGEEDLLRIAAFEHTVVGTDGLVRTLEGNSHPRGFGTFPRAFRLFVKEHKLVSAEQMIHKMTGLTAQRFGLKSKGVIADGKDADLVLMDEENLTDVADYKKGQVLSQGIERVFVAGKTVYRDGKLTGENPGRFIPYCAKGRA